MKKEIKPKKRGLSASLTFVLLLTFGIRAQAQVNSGSDGSDGALNPTEDIVIDMSDHPDGIYHYTSINIPSGITVSFTPNASNTPVVWLVQGDCLIDGVVDVSAVSTYEPSGSAGGPGGYRGGQMSMGAGSEASSGLGPGGGNPYVSGDAQAYEAGNASYGSKGARYTSGSSTQRQAYPGETYGNQYLLSLLGGSGGGGGKNRNGLGGGGGGGGAILIAAGGTIEVAGSIISKGANGADGDRDILIGGAGGGSGGAIRLISSTVTGNGELLTNGGKGYGGYYVSRYIYNYAGSGRVRIDTQVDTFTGTVSGIVTRGFQPIVFLPPSQAVSLSIESVGGIAVASLPTGSPVNPDVIVSANTSNPVTIVVKCENIPLNTEVIIDAKPANGEIVRAVAFNNSGTESLSYATVQISLPRGAGTIQAKAISGIADQFAAVDPAESDTILAQAGWLSTGERFKAIEVTSILGGGQSIVYISESGKRYSMAQ